MPLINFTEVKRCVNAHDVIRVLGLRRTEVSGKEWRGPCPLHEDQDRRERCLNIHLDSNRFYCFWCHKNGDMLELYSLAEQPDVYKAALELCEKVGLPVPWLQSPQKDTGGGGH
jgi:hypothetical protein